MDKYGFGFITLFWFSCFGFGSVVVKLLGLFGEERCSYRRVYFCAGGFSSQLMSSTRRDVQMLRKPSEDRKEVMDSGSTPAGILNFR